MESVSTGAMLLEIFVRDRVAVDVWRDGLVKSGIENPNMRDAGEDLHGRLDPDGIGDVVQGGEWREITDDLQNIMIKDDRSGKLVSPMNYPVADSFHLLAFQRLEDAGEGFGMAAHRGDIERAGAFFRTLDLP